MTTSTKIDNSINIPQLELKHLVPYFAYGLTGVPVFLPNTPIVITELKDSSIKGLTTDGDKIPLQFRINEFKPILRPLCDLTFEQKKILGNKYDVQYGDFPYMFRDRDGEENPLMWIYSDLQKLFEWHFDVFNLIYQNLAIDINTLS